MSKTLENTSEDWYSYPQYYECFFREETPREVRFIEWAVRHLATISVRRIVELGCGGGRLLLPLARKGYRCYGIDNNPQALHWLRKRARKARLPVQAIEADLADFTLPTQVELALCTFNTFRHLLTEQAARQHLARLAAAVRPGGLYILGLHLLPLDIVEEAEERWSARWGRLKLHARLRCEGMNRRKRIEWLQLVMTVRGPQRTKCFRSRFPLRLYTARQFLNLIYHVSGWQISGIYDFRYDWRSPRKLDDDLIDALFVLRREERQFS
ncbi:MAG: class I SAM-dependent methyltransferase [Gemmatales bacterium]|nr:class I SAM-dependent methyltransferase [Gemmatales bacterium]MDW8174887.1 class I SAM-dependent methyltransferase [Gemmatales bacterium]